MKKERALERPLEKKSGSARKGRKEGQLKDWGKSRILQEKTEG